MRARVKSLIITIFASLAFTYCDDSGSRDSGGPGHEPLPAGTFSRVVALSEVTGFFSGLVSSSSPFCHFQCLYKPSDIGGSGPVASICFRRYASTASPGITCPHVTIKLAHTDVENLGDAGSDMSLNIANKGSSVTVLDDATITIPEGDAEEYFEIPLETGFDYNGADNLVVDITRTDVCSNNQSLRSGRVSDTDVNIYTSRARSDNGGAPNICSDTSTSRTRSLNSPAAADRGGRRVTGDRYALFGTDASPEGNGVPATRSTPPGRLQVWRCADVSWTESESHTIIVRMGHTGLSELAAIRQSMVREPAGGDWNTIRRSGACRAYLSSAGFSGEAFIYNGADNPC